MVVVRSLVKHRILVIDRYRWRWGLGVGVRFVSESVQSVAPSQSLTFNGVIVVVRSFVVIRRLSSVVASFRRCVVPSLVRRSAFGVRCSVFGNDTEGDDDSDDDNDGNDGDIDGDGDGNDDDNEMMAMTTTKDDNNDGSTTTTTTVTMEYVCMYGGGGSGDE